MAMPAYTKPQMFCNNCGAQGHVFRLCREPILSSGIILLDSPSLPAPNVKLLMIMRKDSMTIGEFIRGKFDHTDTEYVGRLLENMTHVEHTRLLNTSFDKLWHELVGGMSSDLDTARASFHILDLPSLMKVYPSKYDEPEWGFPKGRRTRGESDIDCATREFGEETNIPRSAYVVLKNVRLEETFDGLNGIRYKHLYFPATLLHPEQASITKPLTTMQKREISGIGWKTIDAADEYIRPHHNQRRTLLNSLRTFVSAMETYPIHV